jgi:RNA polymerase sigma-70 factor (ECF subfamily)
MPSCNRGSELDARLLVMFAQGRAAWPRLRLDPEVFASYVGEHICSDDTDVDAVLREIRAADLYLACACAHGVPGAVSAADEAYLSSLRNGLHHVASSPAFADEVLQILRVKLFVAADGAPPKIVLYPGRPPLKAWMWKAACRVAISLRRKDEARVRASEKMLSEELPVGSNPELDHLKALYRVEFREAFQAAVKALKEQDRAVLRFSLRGLSHAKIAIFYQVNQSTVSRWIRQARESIAEGVKRRLCERLRLSESDFPSLEKLVYSQLDLSLSRWLADDVSPEKKRSN